jgi:hypothetical protein
LIFSFGVFYNAWDARSRGLTKKALLSGLLGAALVLASGLALYFNSVSPWAPRTSAEYGFGPGWQCSGRPASPVCYKPSSFSGLKPSNGAFSAPVSKSQ